MTGSAVVRPGRWRRHRSPPTLSAFVDQAVIIQARQRALELLQRQRMSINADVGRAIDTLVDAVCADRVVEIVSTFNPLKLRLNKLTRQSDVPNATRCAD